MTPGTQNEIIMDASTIVGTVAELALLVGLR